MVYNNKDGVLLYIIKSYKLREIHNKVKQVILLGLSRDLKRLQLTIRFIAIQFIALAGIAVIQVFTKIFSKAILNIFLHNYLIGIVKSIITTYKIVIIPLKDLLL